MLGQLLWALPVRRFLLAGGILGLLAGCLEALVGCGPRLLGVRVCRAGPNCTTCGKHWVCVYACVVFWLGREPPCLCLL